MVGLVLDVRQLVNKKGQRWAIVTLDDKSARMEAKISAELFEVVEDRLKTDAILVISGQVGFDRFNGTNTINARDVMDIVAAREKYAKQLRLCLHADWCVPAQVAKLQALLTEYRGGSCPVVVEYIHPDASAVMQFGAEWFVKPDDQLLYELKQLLNDKQVELCF